MARRPASVEPNQRQTSRDAQGCLTNPKKARPQGWAFFPFRYAEVRKRARKKCVFTLISKIKKIEAIFLPPIFL